MGSSPRNNHVFYLKICIYMLLSLYKKIWTTFKRDGNLQRCENEKDLLRTDGFKSLTSCIVGICSTGAERFLGHQDQRLVGYEWIHL